MLVSLTLSAARGGCVLAAGGALAVDMESAWLQAAAGGRPFAVLRVVLDTPLPRPLELRDPARDLVTARRTLRRAAPALLDWAHTATGLTAEGVRCTP